MSTTTRLRALSQPPDLPLASRVSLATLVLLLLLLPLAPSEVEAKDTGVMVSPEPGIPVGLSPQIDIFVGPDDQGYHGISVAFDSVNNRFLVVWTNRGVETPEIDLYGQLVNADGTLYGGPIAISILNDVGSLDPRAAFDATNGRFLVIWYDNRNAYGVFNIYGQLVDPDGGLYGSAFAISPAPPTYHRAESPAVAFDTVNSRFLVAWIGDSVWSPYNIYAQFVNADGSLHGSTMQVTDYDDYRAAGPGIAFDPSSGRFLVTWANQCDGYVYGRMVDANGTFYGSEINIGYYGLGYGYEASLAADSINGRFLQVWGSCGQLVNADGSLYGTEIGFFAEDPAAHSPCVVFDTTNGKFVVTSGRQYPYLGIGGQVLNAGGSLCGSDFKVFDVLDDPDREAGMGGYFPYVAFGSAQTGSLVVYMDVPHWSLSRIDVFGKLMGLELPRGS